MARNIRIKATVGPFTFAYPHITSPDSEGKYADNKYKVDGIGDPAGAPMKQAQAALAAAVKELGVPKGAMLPIKRETSKNKDGVKEETGNYLFRAKSQFAPAIVDAKGNPVEGAALAKLKVGSGTVGRLQGYFSDYVAAGNPGVSFTLTGIQIIDLKSGGSTADFGAYEGEEGGSAWTSEDLGGDDAPFAIGVDAADDSFDSQGDDGGLDI